MNFKSIRSSFMMFENCRFHQSSILFTLKCKNDFSFYEYARGKLFPPVDADAGVDKGEEESAKVSIEGNAKESDADDSDNEVDAKKKPKKEKVGFRDRKV